MNTMARRSPALISALTDHMALDLNETYVAKIKCAIKLVLGGTLRRTLMEDLTFEMITNGQ